MNKVKKSHMHQKSSKLRLDYKILINNRGRGYFSYNE